MEMIVTAGLAFTVDADSVEEGEDIVTQALIDCTDKIPQGADHDPVPMKVWVAGEFDKDTRTASLAAKDMRAQTEPEYGLLPAGKKMLEERLQKHAEAQAEAMAQAEQVDPPQN